MDIPKMGKPLYYYSTSIFHSGCGGEKCRPAVHCASQFSNKTDIKSCKLDNGEHGLLCKDICKTNGPKSGGSIQTAGFGSGGSGGTPVKPFDASRQVLS